MAWSELPWRGLNCIQLERIELEWIGLEWIELECVVLAWIELEWRFQASRLFCTYVLEVSCGPVPPKYCNIATQHGSQNKSFFNTSSTREIRPKNETQVFQGLRSYMAACLGQVLQKTILKN